MHSEGAFMGKTTAQAVRVEVTREAVRLHLCRPERYNVLDTATLGQLRDALSGMQRRERPLILEGDGDVFSVGVDITELAQYGASEAAAYSSLGQEVVGLLESWPGVTVARLSGYCLGAGLELALGCDLLVANGDIRLGLPGLAWAMVPCLGGLRRLSCRLSAEACSDLFLGGEVLDLDQALDLHLVDRLVNDPGEFSVMLEALGEYSQAAVDAIRSLRLSRRGPIDQRIEAEIFAQPFVSGECQRRLRRLLTG